MREAALQQRMVGQGAAAKVRQFYSEINVASLPLVGSDSSSCRNFCDQWSLKRSSEVFVELDCGAVQAVAVGDCRGCQFSTMQLELLW